ncbi:MAG: hypothetical protein NVSMB62_22090 [Acidobacteriaceae bacterium]
MQPANTTRPRSTLLLILALWAIFYASFTLVSPALLDDADSVHAEVAREMLLRHDYVTLYANDIRYLEKAPLLYWTMALCMRVSQALGHTSPAALATAARVPLAVTVLALALLVEAFARRIFGSARPGLYAALMLLSSPGVFLFTRILLPDAMVCLWLTLALYAFWRAEEHAQPDRAWCWTFATACALNVLTKGLIGIVFPLAIAGLHLLSTRGVRGAIQRISALHPLSSLLVFLVVAAPWHVLAALANPTQGHPGALSLSGNHWSVPLPTDGNVHGWLWFYFVNEQVLRYLNLRVPRDYDTVPLWLFWGLCVVWLMPWSAFAAGTAARAYPVWLRTWRLRLRSLALPSREPIRAFLVLWAAVPLVFFSASTRQEYYVLPALPALILLLAEWLADATRWNNAAELDDSPAASHTAVLFSVGEAPYLAEMTEVRAAGLSFARSLAVLLAAGAVFVAAALYLLLRTHAPVPGTDLASLLQQNPGEYAMSMGHFLDLNAQALGLFRLPLAFAAASLFLGPLAAYVLRRRERPHAATLSLAAGAFGFLLAAHLGLQTFAPVLSSAQLADTIARELAAHPGERPPLIVIHQEFEFGSTLSFYLQRPSYSLREGQRISVEPIHILTEGRYRGTQDYGRSSNLWYGSFFADAPAIFETAQTLAAKWNGPQRIFLWQDLANEPSGLPTLPGPIYVVARSGGKSIVSNCPDH